MTFLDLAVAAFERVKNNPPHLIHVPQDYYTYINSPDWTERKRRYFEIREKQCALCFTRRNIDLHHIRYSDRGNEPDSDLVAICRYHHEQFHRMYGVSGDMRREWQEFSGMLRRSDISSGMIEG